MVDMKTALDAKISRNIGTVMAHTGIRKESLYLALGVSRSAWYDRMGGDTKWAADEVAVVADMLGIAVGELYADRPSLPDRQNLVSVTSGGSDSVTRGRNLTGWLRGVRPKPKRRPHHGADHLRAVA